ncbi:DNA polymerase III subunit beta [Kaistia sp. MMO-174]|uniref:DNA polymerase III subunit beta n=1 Tax=Kaistia sp. MMO-174 TaxID=3081256 RepID=UPI00301B6636
MKLIIEQARLLAILTTCKLTVDTKAPSAILSCVRLSAADNILEAMTTAMDIQSSDQAPAEVQVAGEICVNQSDFHDLVRRLPEGAEVALEVVGAQLLIRAGRVKAAMAGLDARTFPALAPPEYTHSFSLPAGDLARLLRETEFAMCTAEDRFTLCTIYLHTADLDGKPHLRAVATDGIALSWSDMDLPAEADGMPGALLPSRTVNVFTGILGKRADKNATEPVRIDVCDTKVGLSIGTIGITTKLVDGDYPPYRRIIPEGGDVFVKLPRRQLQLASERAVSILDGKSKGIHLEFSGEQEDGLQLSSAAGASTIEDRLSIIIDGGPAKFIVNGQHLARSLASFNCDDISLAISTQGAPLRLFDDKDDSHGVVIMPMRG